MITEDLRGEALLLYKAFRLRSYQELFGRIRERDGSLSATEAFAADVIYLLDEPTLGRFAQTLGISQPNATYKVSNLASKGYVEKNLSKDDKREYRLSVTERFYNYFETDCPFLSAAVDELEAEFTEEELETGRRLLRALREKMEG